MCHLYRLDQDRLERHQAEISQGLHPHLEESHQRVVPQVTETNLEPVVAVHQAQLSLEQEAAHPANLAVVVAVHQRHHQATVPEHHPDLDPLHRSIKRCRQMTLLCPQGMGAMMEMVLQRGVVMVLERVEEGVAVTGAEVGPAEAVAVRVAEVVPVPVPVVIPTIHSLHQSRSSKPHEDVHEDIASAD